MPHECQPASRSERAAAGADLTKRRSVLPPIGTGPLPCLGVNDSEPGRCALSDPWGVGTAQKPLEIARGKRLS
jgi:hypothetical protein